MSNSTNKLSPTVTVVAVVSLCALAMAFTLAIIAMPRRLDATTTTLLVSVFGFVSTSLLSLTALLKTEQTRSDLHNGLIQEKVTKAIESTDVAKALVIADAIAESTRTTSHNRRKTDRKESAE